MRQSRCVCICVFEGLRGEGGGDKTSAPRVRVRRVVSGTQVMMCTTDRSFCSLGAGGNEGGRGASL